MNKNQKRSIKYCLRGHVSALSLRLIAKRTCNLVFVLYCLSVSYLLIFDTTFIADIRLFDNEYIAAIVCFSAVMIGIILLLFDTWQKYRYKATVYSVMENIDIKKFTVDKALKYLALNFTVNSVKLIYMFLSVLPSVFLTAVGYVFLKNGIPASIFIILAVCDVILLFNGIINTFCIIQKFALTDYCFAEYCNESIIKIIKISSYLTDGKRSMLAKYKLRRCLLKLTGFLIPSFHVRETAAEFVLVTDKIIPYVQSEAHTEKPVVFYLGNATAG